MDWRDPVRLDKTRQTDFAAIGAATNSRRVPAEEITLATKTDSTIDIQPVATRQIEIGVLGLTPLILNRMSQKAWHELLLPKGKKNAAEKQSTLKHDPIREFRDSPYLLPQDDAPTYLAVMSSAFKGAMRTAALDLPGAKKAQIGRLVYVKGQYTPVYGVPELFMSVVRSADIDKTPDVRTRAIVPKWGAVVTIQFVHPMLRENVVANLLSAAGVTAGIGDWRPEKGAGDYGQFRVVNTDDAELVALIEEGGRAAQMAAMENPKFYDRETEEMVGWWKSEATSRGFPLKEAA